jgi:aldose 1-epimerase
MENAVQVEEFGQLPDGAMVHKYWLCNSQGMKLALIDLGAAITEWYAPDRQGNFADVVLGFDHPRSYFEHSDYMGAVVGRCGNRIAAGRFELDGELVQLSVNQGGHHLHGGALGYDRQLWTARVISGQSVVFSLHSPDGDQGYPGALDVEVQYTLADNGSLNVVYRATTDAPTIVNLTQHSYFNLAGHDAGSPLRQELRIDADRYLPTDAGQIPVGELAAVDHTPFDFRCGAPIGERIHQPHRQLHIGSGYDHCWVLNTSGNRQTCAVAEVFDPVSGRVMRVYTDQPGMQFYSGNHLGRSTQGKDGARYAPRDGFCLEAQQFPDAPNQAGFPPVVLRPGEVYNSFTRFALSVRMAE